MGNKLLKKLKITQLLNRVLWVRHRIPRAVRRKEAMKMVFFAAITLVLVFVII